MDKSWMREPTRCSDKYQKGVEEFLRMAVKCAGLSDETWCPCRACGNRLFQHIDLVGHHLYVHEIDLTCMELTCSGFSILLYSCLFPFVHGRIFLYNKTLRILMVCLVTKF
jgi:hypothetical protein